MDTIKHLPVSVVFLLAAIILYALMGSATPDNPGVVEILIGGLLVLSVGAAGLSRTLQWSKP